MNGAGERARSALVEDCTHCPSALLRWAALASILVGCQKHLQVSPHAERGALQNASAVSLRAGTAVDDGQWTMPGKDYENTRFSALDQISTSNAAQLRLLWTRPTGVERGHEAAPLAVDDTLYVVTFSGPGGKQYVAVLDGVGGWSGTRLVSKIDPRDQSAALGFSYAMTELDKATKKGGAVYVFALP